MLDNGGRMLAGTFDRFDEGVHLTQAPLSPVSIAWQNSTINGITGANKSVLEGSESVSEYRRSSD